MKFSYAWLADYVELPEGVDELSRRLTAAGLAVEGLEAAGDDRVLDIDVTTNRPDCMCHVGVAREAAAAFDRPLRLPVAQIEPSGEAFGPTTVTLEDPDCLRYVARVVRGVTVGPSPEWLRRRLEAIGQRPINNVVDVTNFVLWETGQPIHAFDLDKLAERRIVVRSARPGESLVTLDGERRELTPSVLVIADARRPVALAGVLGGEACEVTASSSEVLIESAHFAPARVRRGAAELGLHTEASHRFERGADPEACAAAADRVAALLAEVAGGRVADGVVDERTVELPRLWGWLEVAALSRFAGLEISPDTARRLLTGLGFELEEAGEGRWKVWVPSWRAYDFDAGRERGEGTVRVWEADLFEEVLRHVGFDAVPSALPAIGAPDPGDSAEHRLREEVRAHLTSCGLAEAIHYAFHDEASHRRFPGLVPDGPPVRLANPLSESLAVMRRSLLPGLVESARYNARRGREAVALFEIGRLFPAGGAAEVEAVGAAIGGLPGTPWDARRELDLFELKGMLEGLAARFGATLEAVPAAVGGLVDGTSSRLRIAGREAGYLGRLDDPDFPYPIHLAELELVALAAARAGASRQARLPPRHPGVAADLTLTHATATSWSEIDRAIRALEVEHLAEFGLKDRYQGEGVPEGAVNTTIFFLYNARERSLTQDEVNASLERLTRALTERFGRRG